MNAHSCPLAGVCPRGKAYLKKEKQRDYYRKNRDVLITKVRVRQKSNARRKRAYTKKYYKENKEKLKEYAKNYREINKERIRQYYQKNRESILAYQKSWFAARPDYRKNYFRRHKDKIVACAKKYIDRNVKNWKAAFVKICGENPQCQICGMSLTWNGGKNRVNFDHRHGRGLVIRRTPSNWYGTKKFTRKNWEIWKRERFGILCSRCNRSLPTGKKSRRRLVLGILRYWKES